MLKNSTKVAAIMMVVAVMAPAIAFAHGFDGSGDDRVMDRSTNGFVTNEFGVTVLGEQKMHATRDAGDQDKEDQDKNDSDSKNDAKHESKTNRGLHLGEFLHKGFFPNLFYNGTVTATSSSGFTIKTEDGTTFTVDADSATIIQIPNTKINLSDIDVNDTVHITGTKTSDTAVNASVVYVLPANLSPAFAKGTITNVDGNTLTVQTKDDTSVTVNTNADTVITNSDGNTVAQADIETGTKAKLIGFWDSVLHVFNAIRIKLF